MPGCSSEYPSGLFSAGWTYKSLCSVASVKWQNLTK